MIKLQATGLTEKDQNILAILNTIIAHETISTKEIAEQTLLSASTISRVLGHLKARGIIVHKGRETTEKGRRPEILSLNKTYGYLLHFDISYEGVSGFVGDLADNIYGGFSLPIDQIESADSMLHAIGKVYNGLCERYVKPGMRLLAASFSIPGIVHAETKRIHRIPNLFSIDDIDLYAFAESVLNIPVIIRNYCLLKAVGQQISCYPEHKDLVYMDISEHVGIGLGILVGGKPVYGCKNYAGEVGAMYFDRKNFLTKAEKGVGCLEEYAGISALISRLQKAITQGRAPTLARLLAEQGSGRIDLNLIEKAARLGDGDVCEILEDVLRIWSIALINVNLLLNPELVVIGGAIRQENEYILGRLRALIGQAMFYQPEIRVSTLSAEDQRIGGFHLLRQYVYNNIIAGEVIRETQDET